MGSFNLNSKYENISQKGRPHKEYSEQFQTSHTIHRSHVRSFIGRDSLCEGVGVRRGGGEEEEEEKEEEEEEEEEEEGEGRRNDYGLWGQVFYLGHDTCDTCDKGLCEGAMAMDVT
ncbi:high mobility group protein B2-like [Apodemus sylvaticus]|uniref:high mobility group protein B2-like n=1 Tax=Apodemus sylvaticus TaxID=10129 RepID=UPI002242D3ED|nr:high mobility group protein B2-like [Apodemus sylvaticus]